MILSIIFLLLSSCSDMKRVNETHSCTVFLFTFSLFLCWVPEMFCGSVVDPIFAHSFSPAFLHPLLSSLALNGWMTAGPVTEIIWTLFIGALLHWGSLADVAQKLHVMQVASRIVFASHFLDLWQFIHEVHTIAHLLIWHRMLKTSSRWRADSQGKAKSTSDDKNFQRFAKFRWRWDAAWWHAYTTSEAQTRRTTASRGPHSFCGAKGSVGSAHFDTSIVPYPVDLPPDLIPTSRLHVAS